MKRGDAVKLTMQTTVNGWVAIVSPNGASVGVFIDDCLRTSDGGAYMGGFVPLTRRDDGKYYDLGGEEVAVELL